MKVTIAAVGRLKAGPERELVERYLARATKAGRALSLDFAVREFPESAAPRAPDRLAAEGSALAGAVPAGAALVALDERGKGLGSAEFAALIARLRDGGRRELVFLVGGPDGLDPALRKKAESIVSFGPMTLPHQLVRVLVAEQLYRATTILSGHPYHRA
jgi:23S rRNA (pseudouridine1915-N3)-methyltransferase